MWDIIEVKSELKPFDRAWIKEDFELDMIVGPYDGSIEAYGALLYCRSYNAQTDEYDCCLASSRSKCSELDCGDNELFSSLLNAKQAEVLVRSIPEKPKPLRMVPGVPKKSIPKIKVFYKKSRSGILSKSYLLNTLEGLDMIL